MKNFDQFLIGLNFQNTIKETQTNTNQDKTV